MRTLETATRTDWVVDRIVQGFIRSALALPYDKRVRLFGRLSQHGLSPLTGYRKRAIEQLKFIWPDMAPAERKRIADGVGNNFGRTMIENYSGADFAKQVSKAEVYGDGLEAVAEAKAQGRPVLFVTGHFGNHEAPRMALTQRGYTIGGLYRPIANPYFNDHYVKNMQAMSGPVFPQGRRGTSGFVRMLKGGGMGTLLFDVRAAKFPRIPFMGKPAHTATSVADIALKLDTLVVPYFGIRQPDGLSFRIAIEDPIAHSTPAQMMGEITARLEAHVYAHPEQWFWVHRRWK
ncbi:lysophospholipid acyltransferase family protein [Thalassorhabdomicrobium marinisediminis]|uniref:lysophospholipid acyltransferase family protein n=1 Tax=Thalassorhabdomicrobium marinisediminis TaxID=2170577 RepID=UPI0024903B55|nr:lauroyl acyltransferase [Thalassorhabdomicrobium marinisediminis]